MNRELNKNKINIPSTKQSLSNYLQGSKHIEQTPELLAKATKYQTPIELRFKNQSKREGETR